MPVRPWSGSEARLPRAKTSVATLIALLALTAVAQALVPASAAAEEGQQTSCTGNTILLKDENGKDICSEVIQMSGGAGTGSVSIPSPAVVAIRIVNDSNRAEPPASHSLVANGLRNVRKMLEKAVLPAHLADAHLKKVLKAFRRLRCTPDIDWPVVKVACPF
jgi:hypothetical protein